MGDVVAAWKALKERLDGNTKEARCACREKVFTTMPSGGDPTDFISTMDNLRLRLADMAEQILDSTYADLLLNSFAKEFAFIKQMHHRDRSFMLEQIKQTAINFNIDELSRKSSAPTVARRRAAMAAASHSDQDHQCIACGHYQRASPGVTKTNASKRKPKKGKKGRSGDPSPKWCSYHKPNSHSDSQSQKKEELKQLAVHLADLRSTDQTRLANIGSAHLVQTSQPHPPTLGFSFSAKGASLVEADASSTISGSTPANLSAKPAAPETPSLQLGSVPSETSQHNHRTPEGPLVPSWRLPLPCRLLFSACLLYTSPSPRDKRQSRMPSSA